MSTWRPKTNRRMGAGIGDGHCDLEHGERVDDRGTGTGVNGFLRGTLETQLKVETDDVKVIGNSTNCIVLVEIYALSDMEVQSKATYGTAQQYVF